MAGHFFARRQARHMGRRGRSVRPVGRPPGPGKSGRLRGGPVVRTFGEGGGVGGRASLMGGGRRNAACRGRTFRGRRPPGLRASARPRAPKPGLFARAAGIAAQARPSSAGKARLINHYPPVCVHPVHAPIHACPRPAPACIVLPRAAPQPMRPREPREPDTAEDAGGQTDHSGQAFQGGLRRKRFFHKPPSFKNSLNPFI